MLNAKVKLVKTDKNFSEEMALVQEVVSDVHRNFNEKEKPKNLKNFLYNIKKFSKSSLNNE